MFKAYTEPLSFLVLLFFRWRRNICGANRRLAPVSRKNDAAVTWMDGKHKTHLLDVWMRTHPVTSWHMSDCEKYPACRPA